MGKFKFRFRDLLAAPAMLLGLLFLWLAVSIGGAWTASRFVIHAPTSKEAKE